MQKYVEQMVDEIIDYDAEIKKKIMQANDGEKKLVRFLSKVEPLKDYYDKHKSISGILFHEKYKFKGKIIKIGGLVSRLRTKYKNGELEDYQIAILEKWGMIWENCSTYIAFKNNLKVLKAYAELYGSIAQIKQGDVFSYNGSFYNVGYLINTYRKKYKKISLDNMSEMDKYFVSELEKLGMVWEAKRGNKTEVQEDNDDKGIEI